MELTRRLFAAGNADNGALGAVLGDEAGRDTAVGVLAVSACVWVVKEIVRGEDGGGGGDGAWGEVGRRRRVKASQYRERPQGHRQ